MATYVSDTIIQTKDKDGNIIIHYPVSLSQNILLSDTVKAALGISSDDATVEDGLNAILIAVSGGALDFNNPIAWPGCTRITPPEDTETATTVEQWVDTASLKANQEDGITTIIVKAQRTTVENADGSYLETYIFYEDDGTTVKQKFTVVTTQDGETETYYEEVTEVIE